MTAALRKAKPATPLILITHFLNRDHHPLGERSIAGTHQIAYDRILRELQKDAHDPHLHLIEGTDILDDFSLLGADLIHPTQEGIGCRKHDVPVTRRVAVPTAASGANRDCVWGTGLFANSTNQVRVASEAVPVELAN